MTRILLDKKGRVIKNVDGIGAINEPNLIPENIKKDINILGVVGSYENSNPIEVATSSEMDALLVANNVGNIYKYVGETDSTYTNGSIYIVESE